VFKAVGSDAWVKAGLIAFSAAAEAGLLSPTAVIAGSTFGAFYLLEMTFLPAYAAFLTANAGRVAGVAGQSASDLIASVKPLASAYFSTLYSSAKDVFKDVLTTAFPSLEDGYSTYEYFEKLTSLGEPNEPISEIVDKFTTIQQNLPKAPPPTTVYYYVDWQYASVPGFNFATNNYPTPQGALDEYNASVQVSQEAGDELPSEYRLHRVNADGSGDEVIQDTKT
jgi:hypothetical protein